tara:strand:- start:22 stop:483 length:462 start_codon:yes stop_codon:yes gene_type:complete
LFQDDLATGERVERMVLNQIRTGRTPLLGEAYPNAYKVEGYFKGYDLFVPEIEVRIEVKRDVKSQETGNLVIEIEYGGNASALATTEADYWVFWDGECWIWTTPWRIRKAINGLPVREFTGKGDPKPKKAYLCPKGKIKNTAEYVIYEIHSTN